MDDGAEGEAVIPARGKIGHRNLNRIAFSFEIIVDRSSQDSP